MAFNIYNNDATHLLNILMEDDEFIKLLIDKRARNVYSPHIYSDIFYWHERYQDWLKNEYKFTNEKAQERYEEHFKRRENLIEEEKLNE